jgi:glycerophosphoryl diester phosphodiesterase
MHDVEPENSLAAFEAASRAGADGIEFDVQVTADGELVIFHDLRLEDLSDGRGYIFESTLEAVRAATLERTAGATSDGRIPLLGEVLALPDLSFELEVKTLNPTAIDDIVRAVQDAELETRVEFTSVHAAVLARIRALVPGGRIGVFCRTRHPLVPEAAHRRQVIGECELLSASCLHLPTTTIDDDWVERCRAGGLLVHAANVNEADDLANVRRLGVDQLSTDNCELVFAAGSGA